jgi:hypothetical protein
MLAVLDRMDRNQVSTVLGIGHIFQCSIQENSMREEVIPLLGIVGCCVSPRPQTSSEKAPTGLRHTLYQVSTTLGHPGSR